MPDPEPDLYAILGVSPDATAQELKAAYRQQMKENHPDKIGGTKERYKDEDDPLLQAILDKARREAEDKTKLITAAYGVLGDPTRRARYDARRLATHPSAAPGTGPTAATSRPAPQAPPRPASGAPKPPPPPPPRRTATQAPSDRQLRDVLIVQHIKGALDEGHYQAAYDLTQRIASPVLRQQWQALILAQAPTRRATPDDRTVGGLACPTCGGLDRLTKVSALVAAQHHDGRLVTRGRFTGHRTSANGQDAGYSQGTLRFTSRADVSSTLARQLSPRLGLSSLEIVAGLGSLPFACLMLLILASLLLRALTPTMLASLPVTPAIATARGISSSAKSVAASSLPLQSSVLDNVLCLAGDSLPIFVLFQLPPLRAARRQRRAMRERWTRALYCDRCGLVFIEGERHGVAPRDFKALLRERQS